MNTVFSPLSVRNKILNCLNELDYLLFNEKDLQIYLAIKLKEQDYKVYTEYRLPKGFNKGFDDDYKLWETEKPSIDIVLEYNGQYIAIELKYKLKEIKGKLERFGQESNEEFSLVTNQSAQNEARYDFWKDVKRLELIQEHYNIIGGIALFITNDESYKSTNQNCEYSKFGLEEKKEKGKLYWGKEKKIKGGKKKRPNFELAHSYVGIWEPESLHFNNEKFHVNNEKFHVYSVMVDNKKLFTKSAFKTALTCPRQLYYYYDSKTYANQNNDDGFLQALAEGGFQVGELAKIYYGVDADSDIKTLDCVSSIEQTKKLFERDDVCIAEAAFRYKNCFVRVDLLKKNDDTLELIEVKAKSWDEKSSFTQKKKSNRITSDILPYLYDVAFQKWVVINALKEQYPDTPYTVKAFLMMADKDKTASVDGMNQYFRIGKDENKRIMIERETNAEGLKDCAHILTPFPVDEYCDKIIRGETEEQQEVMGYKFEDFVEKMGSDQI